MSLTSLLQKNFIESKYKTTTIASSMIPFSLLPNESNLNLSDYVVLLGLSYGMDKIIQFANSKVKNHHTDSKKSQFEKVLTNKELNSLKKEVFPNVNSNNIEVYEDSIQAEGISTQRGGYFSKITFKAEGNEREFFYKYVPNNDAQRGKIISELVDSNGVNLGINIGESTEKGVLYEFVDSNGTFEFDQVMTHLQNFYSSQQVQSQLIQEGRSIKKGLERTLESFGDSTFVNELKNVLDTFQGHTLVHGDLHRDNILINSNGEATLIDIDNMNSSLPIEDYMFLAYSTKQNLNRGFEKNRQKFLEWQKNEFPDSKDSDNELLSFITTYKFLVKESQKENSSNGKVNALINDCRKYISSYSSLESNFALEDKFNLFIQENFDKYLTETQLDFDYSNSLSSISSSNLSPEMLEVNKSLQLEYIIQKSQIGTITNTINKTLLGFYGLANIGTWGLIGYASTKTEITPELIDNALNLTAGSTIFYGIAKSLQYIHSSKGRDHFERVLSSFKRF